MIRLLRVIGSIFYYLISYDHSNGYGYFGTKGIILLHINVYYIMIYKCITYTCIDF